MPKMNHSQDGNIVQKCFWNIGTATDMALYTQECQVETLMREHKSGTVEGEGDIKNEQ